MYEDDPWLKRRRGSGLLLVPFLIFLLAYPLWHWRGLGHPLAGETSIDLCARLSPVPALMGLRAEGFPGSGNVGACRWRDSRSQVRLEASLATTRGNGGMDMDRLFDQWHNEVKAAWGPDAGVRVSGSENARVLSYNASGARHRLIEDHGVLLLVSSSVLDDEALDALVEPVRSALRTDPGK